jgi:hypothetical protein
MIINGRVPKLHLSAINHFADLLFTTSRKNRLEITVKYQNLDVLGSLHIDSYDLKGKPDSFVVEVNRFLTTEEKLKTLAHEMVHVKQYSLGYLNESMTCWRGKKIDRFSIDYEELPWEIEAESYGLNLYESFMYNKQ